MKPSVFTCLVLATLAALLAQPASGQATLFFEDFEDDAVGYTPSVPDTLTNAAAGDYFGRFGVDTAPLPTDIAYQNQQGSGFYAVQDTNAANDDSVDNVQLEITGISIAGFQNLSFSFFVAEDESEDGEEDWDSTTSLSVEFQIDGGGFQDLLAFEAELGIDDNPFVNEVPRVDTNFDGLGNGQELTDVFTPFTQSISGSGTVLDLRINLDAFNAADEDVAIDNLLVTGDPTGDAPPGDYNGDFVVTAADFPVFRDTFGESGADLPADGDSSGTIGLGDFEVWVANFGAAVGIATATPVPEPAGLMLFSIYASASVFVAPRGRNAD